MGYANMRSQSQLRLREMHNKYVQLDEQHDTARIWEGRGGIVHGHKNTHTYTNTLLMPIRGEVCAAAAAAVPNGVILNS